MNLTGRIMSGLHVIYFSQAVSIYFLLSSCAQTDPIRYCRSHQPQSSKEYAYYRYYHDSMASILQCTNSVVRAWVTFVWLELLAFNICTV